MPQQENIFILTFKGIFYIYLAITLLYLFLPGIARKIAKILAIIATLIFAFTVYAMTIDHAVNKPVLVYCLIANIIFTLAPLFLWYKKREGKFNVLIAIILLLNYYTTMGFTIPALSDLWI
jgi:hypothetical protein